MDEAKSLINMFLSAMLSASIIMVSVGAIGIGYTIWSRFEHQDETSKAMAEYSNYTAYDNTTVRGQEVMQLIEDNNEIFVIILQSVSGNSMNDLTIGSGKKAYVWCHDAACARFELSQAYARNNSLTSNSNKTCQRALQSIYTWTYPTSGGSGCSTLEQINYDGANYIKVNPTDLQNMFLDPNVLGTGDNDYAAFKSVLIYADDTSNSIAGVVLVKQNSTTTEF